MRHPKAWNDRSQYGHQNMSTKHLKIMHGIDGSIKLTWQHNVAGSDLPEITVTEIGNSKYPTLHVCASHHRAHENTWIALL